MNEAIEEGLSMQPKRNVRTHLFASAVLVGLSAGGGAAMAQQQPQTQQQPQAQQQQQTQQKPPNILVIMGDDVGWFNIGAYHRWHHVRQDTEPR